MPVHDCYACCTPNLKSLFSASLYITVLRFLICSCSLIKLTSPFCVTWNRDRVVPGNIWEEVLLLGLVVALIAVLMATGLVIARLGTGRINAIAVEKEVI